ncbi:MAG: hypothetical protein ACUVTZ_04865 [Armatimonadota bacterium]
MLFGLVLLAATQVSEPIALHPDNSHYFIFRGKPTVLITSGEHYGAVLNLDFDYVPYLDELKANRFNLTRTFTGVYMEDPKAFNIAKNTLSPAPGRLICPWARSKTPGYANGGNKFDLTKWDDAYFARLKDFIRQADRRGVVVELVLFCPYYGESMWNLSPLNARNNVNGIGNVPRTEVLTLKHKDLVAVQTAMVEKIVRELNGFDNLYYEICNEPYFGGVTLDWQAHIADTIVKAEASLPKKHLIAQNISNGSARIKNPHPAVSIFNFHYSNPPDSVAWNYHLNKVIAFDETGFKGIEDKPYRTDAWEFIIAGGAVYSHLDYSFTAEHERGTFVFPPTQPGGGGPSIRRQLRILKDFIHSLDFLRMKPDNSAIKGGVPQGAVARALVNPGNSYAIYVKGGTKADLVLDLPAGRYRAEWVNTLTGRVEKTDVINHQGGSAKLSSPSYSEDIALKIVRTRGR